ncbi:MAG: flagellar hook-basal body complex protein FliE [Spirochaetales bacterium]|jgi:flagellar hook-basal body complex protein FliE|nr:flagellar hook-basal body complex protein FliE [Spirochaetales bacterium]
MAFLSALQVSGDAINLTRTNSKHFGGVNDTQESGKTGDFGAMLMKAINGVNQMELESNRLSTQMVTDPDSVEAHDVTIAMAQANLAVSLTKAVVDKALQAYSSIINMR